VLGLLWNGAIKFARTKISFKIFFNLGNHRASFLSKLLTPLLPHVVEAPSDQVRAINLSGIRAKLYEAPEG
jgi:hypothetical protein